MPQNTSSNGNNVCSGLVNGMGTTSTADQSSYGNFNGSQPNYNNNLAGSAGTTGFQMGNANSATASSSVSSSAYSSGFMPATGGG
ncbi:unnamed protein product, partial [Amoebophrya sp. A25]|eukprot:GSA25T00009554001.1